jgi:HEAT repeat protein
MDDINQLVNAVLDPDQDNLDAFVKLAGMDDPRIAELLIPALRNTNPIVRKKAILNLGETRDPRAIQPIMDCLDDENTEVRLNAIHVLAYFGVEQVIQPIIQKLTDPEEMVRLVTVMALGRLKDDRAVEPLISLLPELWFFVIDALIAIGDKRAVEPLISLLKYETTNSDHDFQSTKLRITAAQALGEFGDARAVDALVELLSDWHNEGLRVSDHTGKGTLPAFPSMCHYAAQALEKIGTPEALERLQKWRSTPFPGGLESR